MLEESTMADVEEKLMRERLHRLHVKGGGQEGMAIPFDDGELGVVTFQIHDKAGKIKGRPE